MVAPFQAFAFFWLGKFGPSRALRRRLWEYKERLTVGRTRVFVVMIVVDIVGSALFLLSPFSILVPFFWVSIAEGQKITMDPDGYPVRKYGFFFFNKLGHLLWEQIYFQFSQVNCDFVCKWRLCCVFLVLLSRPVKHGCCGKGALCLAILLHSV